jgi:hypothetical protein
MVAVSNRMLPVFENNKQPTWALSIAIEGCRMEVSNQCASSRGGSADTIASSIDETPAKGDDGEDEGDSAFQKLSVAN